jgi:malonyl-CoA/methylmalonyl-CoA synthetase
MMGVPTFYSRLLERPELSRHRCAKVRLFTSGSAPLSAETFVTFERRTGHRILERYGMTETLITTTNLYAGARRPGVVGFPLEDVEIRISEEGELQVKGPNVFAGYFHRPEQTEDAFCDDGFFKTGDVARFDDDGFVVLTGRATDVIITGGENVYPREVELALEEINDVADAAIFGLPHADLGEAVTALVVPSSSPIDEASILRRLSSSVAGYKVPKRIFFADSIPRNAMGKVDRTVLVRRYNWAYS